MSELISSEEQLIDMASLPEGFGTGSVLDLGNGVLRRVEVIPRGNGKCVVQLHQLDEDHPQQIKLGN